MTDYDDDELTPEEDAEFAALPEALRLALVADARGTLRVRDDLSTREIADLTGIPRPRIERTIRVAVMKLRRRASLSEPT
jgi:DNA-directed RNA polymerase specialized sigma24 family protein